MRGFILTLLAVSSPVFHLSAQTVSAKDVQTALVGSWVGTLEYRDFAEDATSTKRVKLPTWLKVEQVGTDLRFQYTYDDGPSKTVNDTSLIHIDPNAGRCTVLDPTGKIKQSYAIAGLAQFRQGRGTLTLTGSGTENGAPVDVRMTIRIGRNILEITRETAVPGQPFAFRHAYTLVRATPGEQQA